MDRLRAMVRVSQGSDTDPSGSVVDVRSVRAAATVGAASGGFDAAKNIGTQDPRVGRYHGLVDSCRGGGGECLRQRRRDGHCGSGLR